MENNNKQIFKKAQVANMVLTNKCGGRSSERAAAWLVTLYKPTGRCIFTYAL